MSDNPNFIPRNPGGAFLDISLEETQLLVKAAIDALKTSVDTALAVLTAIRDVDGIKKISDALPAGTNTVGKIDQGVGGASAWKTDGSATIQPVSGPLTDAQLRTSAVPVSAAALPLPTDAATEATLAAVKAGTDNLDVPLSTLAGGSVILKQEVEIQTAVIYVGTAPLATATSDPNWRIKRILITGGGAEFEIEWTGTTAIWDNRATETYS